MNRLFAPHLPVPQRRQRLSHDGQSRAWMRTVLESLSAILVLWQTLVSGWMIGCGPCRVEGSGLKWGRVWASRRRSVVPGWGPFRMRQQ
ncbi:MAG: hypothetical protein ACKOFW_11475, partial [Planctomycetaceae bacterium]